MRKTTSGLLSLALASGLGAMLTVPIAAASPAASPSPSQGTFGEPQTAAPSDSLPDPIADKQAELRKTAVASVLKGEAKPERIGNSTVVKVGEAEQAATAGKGNRKAKKAKKVDQYVELSREKTDKVFVVVAEFGDQRHPSYPDKDPDPDIPGPTTFDGPLVNQIPEPDRAVDNSTVWQPDFDQAHYQDLYFGTARTGARVDEAVLREAVLGPLQRRRHGHRLGEGALQRGALRPQQRLPVRVNVCSNTWYLVAGRAWTPWVADQQAAAGSRTRRSPTPDVYDQWDRYDYDGDGNFNEPDGYIDHFQIVHAGGDQADGDPIQGEDAIWSHRWYAFQGNTGTTGAEPSRCGGTPVGNTGLWVGDYTIQPENGGLDVFAHEYGHDLGPAGPLRHLRAGASREPGQLVDAHGPEPGRAPRATTPSDPRAPTSAPGTSCSSAGSTTRPWWPARNDPRPRPARVQQRQGPGRGGGAARRRRSPRSSAPRPPAPSRGGAASGDDLNNSLSRSVTLPAGAGHADRSRPTGTSRTVGRTRATTRTSRSTTAPASTPIPGSITTAAEGNGIDGDQHRTGPRRRSTCRRTPARRSTLRFRYATDGGARRRARASSSTTSPDRRAATTLFTDGAESGANGWTADGFTAVGATSDHGLRQLLHRRPTGRTCRTTSTCRPVRTTSGSPDSRTTSSTSRTRTACSSPTGTPRRATTTRASTPGRG